MGLTLHVFHYTTADRLPAWFAAATNAWLTPIAYLPRHYVVQLSSGQMGPATSEYILHDNSLLGVQNMQYATKHR